MADWRRRVGRIVTDAEGAIGGVSVTVYKAGTTTKVTLKDNKAGTEALANPFETNAHGVWAFFIDVDMLSDCDYELDIVFSKSGLSFTVMNEMYENHSMIGAVNVTTAVLETDFAATTFLYATLDDTPEPKTPAEVMAILSAAANGVNTDITALRGLATQNAIQINPFNTGVGETGEIRFLELAAGGMNYVGFKAADALAGNVIWVLPTTDSSGPQYLKSDGSGNLSWGIPAGAGDVSKVGTPVDNEIGIWTGDGTLEGDTNFQWDGSAFKMLGTIFIKEQADAAADVAGYGQIWVDTATPNKLYFTDDAGNDRELIYSGGAFHDGFSDFAIGEHFTQANITAVGTIETGTWQGSAIDHERGGLEANVSAYNGLVKISGGSTSAVTITTAGAAILDDANASAQRTTLGLIIDSDVLAYDTGLSNLAGIAMVADRFYYTSADNTHVAGTVTAFARSILDDADEATFKATVNLEIGTDVLAEQTIGIADDNLVEVDGPVAGVPASGEYARWTANGLEGRQKSEVLSDLNVADGADVTGSNAPQAHKDSHDPQDGGDALDTAAPSEIAGVQAAAVGTSHSFARADHAHQIQHGIADNHLVTVDQITPVATDYARFTANGLEGREPSEVRTDLGLVIGTNVLAEQTIGIADNNLVEIDDADAASADYCRLTANGIEGRSYSEVMGDLSGQAAADFAMNTHKITDVTDPTAAQDVATKAYVDSVAQGLNPLDTACAVGTTEVLPACTAAGSGVGKTLTADANGVLTIDGTATVLNDRILVKNQASAVDNGIYKVTTEGTAGVAFVLTRATDFDADADLASSFVFVSTGTTNADTGWVCTNEPEACTIDTDNITFTQFSAAGHITPGTGLAKSGNTLSVDEVLQDLDTLGVVASDGQIIVGTGAGVFAYESGATARASLGLTIDTHVLAYDVGLSNLAGIAMVADRFYYTSADNTHVAGTVTSFARSILDDADEATFKATVNLEIGIDVLAEQTIGIADDNLLEVDDADAAATDYARFTANGLQGRDVTEVKTDLGLVIGTNVQAYDAELTALAGLTSAANAIPYFTGSETASVISSSANIIAWLASANYATARTNLSIGTGDSPTFTGLTLSGLTAGRVVFVGASDVLDDDGALLWDDTNKRLGLGIAPTDLLHLYQDASGYLGSIIRNANASVTTGTQIKLTARNESGFIRYTNSSGTQTFGGAYNLEFINGWDNDAGNILFITKGDGASPLTPLTITGGGNLLLGSTTFGVNAEKNFVMATGTAPTSSVADTTALWSADVNAAAGYAWLHGRDEKGHTLIVAGVVLKTDTGHPANPHEGLIEINTNDNKVNIYGDAGWREMASW